MDWTVFEDEWNDLMESLYEKGILVQCFYVSENLMPEGTPRVVFKGRLTSVPAEKAPYLMADKYSFEAYRNYAVCSIPS